MKALSVLHSSSPHHSIKLLLRAIFVLAGLTSSSALAQITTEWEEVNGGLFQNSDNWSDGVPGAADTAIFDLDAALPYTVTFNADAATDQLEVRDDQVIFSIGTGTDDFTYTLGSAFHVGFDTGENSAATINRGTLDGDARFHIGQNGTGILTISNGAIVDIDRRFDLGFSASGNGTMVVTGTGTQVSIGGSETNTIGRRGTGELQVLDGAHFIHDGRLDVGHRNNGAKLLIDDALMEVSGRMLVGWDGASANVPGRGEVEVRNGGRLVTSLAIELGTVSSSTDRSAEGDLLITGAGSRVEVDRDLILGEAAGGPTAANYIGRVHIEDGGVLDSGVFGNNRDAFLGRNGGVGEVTVGGAGSQWIHNSREIFIGDDQGGTGLLRLEDGGSATFQDRVIVHDGSRLEIASGSIAGNALDLESGAVFELTLATIDLAAPRITLDDQFDPGGATFVLELAAGFSANLNDTFVVVEYDEITAAIFDGLPEGAVLGQDGYLFRVSYGVDVSDAFTLTVIPEPGTALLLISSLLLTLIRRGRRARG